MWESGGRKVEATIFEQQLKMIKKTTEFKSLVTRILKKLIGYFNSIKKIQAEMKVTRSEIKKNLQGINS